MFFLFLNESNILLSVNIGLKLFMVVGVIGVNALMAIKLGFVTALPKQMEDYPVLVQTEDYAQQNLLKLFHVSTMYLEPCTHHHCILVICRCG